jgi:hypothetical protein
VGVAAQLHPVVCYNPSMKLYSALNQLKKERDKVERHLAGLNAAISAFTGVYRGKVKPIRTRPRLSAKARARIAAAQRARWAKWRKAKKKA